MKKTLAALVACLALTGCVANPAKVEAQNQMAAFQVDLRDLIARRKIGIISESAYHNEAYELTNRYSQFPDAAQMRAFHAKMIPVARALDAGQITKDQYNDVVRIEGAASQDAITQRRREAIAAEEARKDQAMRDLQRTLEIMNASRPPPQQFIQPLQQTCDTQYIGGIYRTRCY